MLVIVGMSTEEHFLRSQVGIGSESDHLLGQSNRILYTLHSDAGLKVQKKQEVLMEEKVYCGDTAAEMLFRDIQSLEILSVKKEAKLSAIEVTEEEEGKGDEDLRCSNLFTVC